MSSPWNAFVKRHAGSGATMTQLAAAYRSSSRKDQPMRYRGDGGGCSFWQALKNAANSDVRVDVEDTKVVDPDAIFFDRHELKKAQKDELDKWRKLEVDYLHIRQKSFFKDRRGNKMPLLMADGKTPIDAQALKHLPIKDMRVQVEGGPPRSLNPPQVKEVKLAKKLEPGYLTVTCSGAYFLDNQRRKMQLSIISANTTPAKAPAKAP